MATTTTTTKVQSLVDFKATRGITRLDIFTSRNTKKRYAVDNNGYFVGMLADDIDLKGSIVVFYMANTETSETWLFIANGEPRQAEATI